MPRQPFPEDWGELAVAPGGRLLVAGQDAVELAQRFGTPLYVFQESVFRRRCRLFREAWEPWGGEVAYAAKAFLSLGLVRILREEGLSLDVVSAGELRTALLAGFDPARIYFHGNNKSDRELALALETGVGHLVVDNLPELERLGELAGRRGRRVTLLLRVAPGIEAHTHSYVRTGQQDTKFGFDLASGQALEAALRAASDPWLDLEGFHAHIGSQILELEPYLETADLLLDLAAQLRERSGYRVRRIDVGGGFGVTYLPEQPAPPVPSTLARLGEYVARGAERRELGPLALTCEPGRSLAGPSMVALYRVGAVKRVPGLPAYVAVDGGMGDNPRPALYGARYAVLAAGAADRPGRERVRVVGKYCESGDFLVEEALLPEARPGDVLALPVAGAYQVSMASNYNRFPRPGVLALGPGGQTGWLLRPEREEELWARDAVPAWLEGRVESDGDRAATAP
ncbi:MAG: diaminopimelate decarboxylase [Clostridia bacterium]|nr:diaminopimelate decarboxylase [Clostridia bacterium]MCL6522882.1 diaminopimelate decarboxylase [Bacillota bacterium]